MADFCAQCTNSVLGLKEEQNDFNVPLPNRLEPLQEGEGFVVLCEGCGPTCVDYDGKCLVANCQGGELHE